MMRSSGTEDVRRIFDKIADRYDRQMSFWERILFAGSRDWVVGQARGAVLEIAVGTGLNLPCYPPETSVLGVELSGRMLSIARQRIADAGVGQRVELRQGDVQALELPDASVDTVVSTFTLCTIPDPAAALGEAYRVLRPGGRILLAEHGRASNPVVAGLMRTVEPLTVRFGADHLSRDPVNLLAAAGFRVDDVGRSRAGVSCRVRGTRAE